MITKELFNTLPQLDRIEFRQKRDAIIGEGSPSFTVTFVIAFLLIIPGTAILIGLANSRELMLQFLSNISQLEFLIWIVLAIMVVSDIKFALRKHKELKDLTLDYFKIEIGVKKDDKRKKRK